MKDFSKILMARESPKNHCLGPTGAWLVPATNWDRPRTRITKNAHYFVSLEARHSNAFGWVEELRNPVTADGLQQLDREALRRRSPPSAPIEMPEVSWYEAYLEGVSRYPSGTPMACAFREVRLPGVARRSLFVHKVIFHDM